MEVFAQLLANAHVQMNIMDPDVKKVIIVFALWRKRRFNLKYFM